MWKVSLPPSAAASIASKLRPALTKAAKVAMPKVAALISDRVSTEASGRLGASSAEVYKEALHAPGAIEITDTGVEIRISNPLAYALEVGSNAFDIKQKMLPHATKFAKDGGPYVDVPFQHGISPGTKRLPPVPDDVRLAMRAAVKSAIAAEVSVGIPKEIAATATVRLKQTTAGKKFTRELRFGGKTISTLVEHKRGIHDDMIRTAIRGWTKVGTSYSTIRRISGKSAATSWWHPGFKGAGIIKTVMPAIRKDIEAIIRDTFSASGLKVKFK